MDKTKPKINAAKSGTARRPVASRELDLRRFSREKGEAMRASRLSIYDTGIRRAIAVLGSELEAVRWMGAPVRALNYATPISLLHDAEGLKAVETVLGRLEHGVL